MFPSLLEGEKKNNGNIWLKKSERNEKKNKEQNLHDQSPKYKIDFWKKNVLRFLLILY